ncbi:MAG: bifunctional phosphoglucose/phosphomannose isomerase [Candidatus Micrarchaeota archaeon]
MTVLDSFNMRGVLLDSHKQFEKGLALAKGVAVEGCDKLVLLGMGGSALPGDLLNFCFGLSIRVSRDYDCPPEVDGKTLVLACSYSGNTEETLSAAKQAFDAGGKLVCIATGGKLKKFADEFGLPFVELPSGIQPRCATGYFFSSLTKVLANSGFLDLKDDELKALSEWLGSKDFDETGRKIAVKIKGSIPVFYSSSEWWPIARVCKIKINENSKQPAFYNVFPELNHNEMVGFTNPVARFTAVFLRNPSDDERVKRRMEITRSLLNEKGVNSIDYQVIGESALQTCFSTLLFFDWASYHLALENGVDPTPVEMVEGLKKKLASKP